MWLPEHVCRFLFTSGQHPKTTQNSLLVIIPLIKVCTLILDKYIILTRRL